MVVIRGSACEGVYTGDVNSSNANEINETCHSIRVALDAVTQAPLEFKKTFLNSSNAATNVTCYCNEVTIDTFLHI